ncbi:Ppx-GppA-domain-containing protein [Microthyrium microscopicum]|uniref:Ppx-GppA-domain-containing protein n=1 Tax=Microthyrium microscopicum TaxID=703497 RepID=A0A6A6UGZ2_9PEZI|nr:Ppx-GppA-domain-containing protein [Microthyrium microscopicum]
MGSNGVRFSVTDLSPPTSRILPTLYIDRAGISLYDAQYVDGVKVPIPEDTMDAVIQTLVRFKQTCQDFGVPDNQIRIIATEATRVALNSEEYRQKIKDATSWDVEMLPKEEEGRTGAMGVASSFENVRGLMMDLGGGSTQITWLISKDGELQMSPAGSVSMPYGAAALTRGLSDANKSGGSAMSDFRDGITGSLKAAVEKIGIPEELLNDVNSPEGLNLYMSGGGFRGWGFLLMSQHAVSPYPIPIINGFKTSINQFQNTNMVQKAVQGEEEVFRVSERRASQVPAVAFLVSCVMEALPAVRNVHFAQGGVREGALFSSLDPATRAQHPFVAATKPYATADSDKIATLLWNVAPESVRPQCPILKSLAQGMYIHNSLNKDIQAAAALRSTTTGALGAVHGADHRERALLAVMLNERWGGAKALSPSDSKFRSNLLELLGDEAWMALFFGRVAALIGKVFPAGVLTSSQSSALGDTAAKVLPASLTTSTVFSVETDPETAKYEGLIDAVENIGKLGKKKHWPSSDGHKIETQITSA